MATDLEKIQEELRLVKEEKLTRLQKEFYRRNPLAWVVNELKEDPKYYEWSTYEAYQRHDWDGDVNPLLTAWNTLGKAYEQVQLGQKPDYRFVAVEAATGCHAKGQGILMYDGSVKRVEDVAVGDLLMGDDSTPRKVLSLARGREQMYKITPNKGEPYIVNKSHILNLKLTGAKPYRNYPLQVNISVQEYLKKSNYWKHLYKQWTTGVEFESKDLPYDPYFVGIWLGDGNKDSSAVTTIDEEIKDYLYSFASSINAQVSKRDSQGSKTPNYLIHFGNVGLSANPLKQFLKTFVQGGQKRIRKDYLTASRLERLALLAGLIDSDGTADGAGISYSTIYEGLADDVIYLCRSLGFQAVKKFHKNNYNGYYAIHIAGDCYEIPLLLERKRPRRRKINKDVRLSGFSVEALEEDDYYGFELDGNHLYLMDSFVVTHNTSKTFWLARLVTWFLSNFENSLVVTSAPKQDQLSFGLWAEIGRIYPKIKMLHKQAELFKLRLAMDTSGVRNVTEDNLEAFQNLDSWHCVGFVAGVAANEESTNKARGFHRKYMLIILEECTGMPLPTLTAFQNTCTGMTNFIVAVGNPDNEFDPLHQFAMQPDVKNIRISAYDYPNIVLQKEIYSGAVTQVSIDARAKTYGINSSLYNAMVRGISPSQNKDSLIKLEWVDQCIRDTFEQFEQAGYGAVGVDVANSTTGDKAALAFGEGNVLKAVQEFQCSNATHLAYNLIYSESELLLKGYTNYNTYKLSDFNIDAQYVGVDAVGVGVATVNAFTDLGYVVRALQGGYWSDVVPKAHGTEDPLYRFSSLRSQMYWELREDLRNKQIIIRIDDPKMRTQIRKELTIPKFEASKHYITIEAKEDIKKRLGGKSPNVADAIAYWNWVRKGYRLSPTLIPALLGGYTE